MSASSLVDRLSSNKTLAKVAPQLTPVLASLNAHMHLIGRLPLVLTHKDLASVNLFVDDKNGSITGVIDWDGARIEAFGMSLHGVYECFMGGRTGNEFHFYETPTKNGKVRDVLEDTFWKELWLSIPSHSMTEISHGPAVRAALPPMIQL